MTAELRRNGSKGPNLDVYDYDDDDDIAVFVEVVCRGLLLVDVYEVVHHCKHNGNALLIYTSFRVDQSLQLLRYGKEDLKVGVR